MSRPLLRMRTNKTHVWNLDVSGNLQINDGPRQQMFVKLINPLVKSC